MFLSTFKKLFFQRCSRRLFASKIYYGCIHTYSYSFCIHIHIAFILITLAMANMRQVISQQPLTGFELNGLSYES